MKSTISFLCRFPGTFIITFLTLAIVIFHYRHEFDDRVWLGIFLTLVVTYVANIYLVFAHMGIIKQMKSAGRWIGFCVMGVLTVLFAYCAYLLYTEPQNPFPSEHALHGIFLYTSLVVVAWAWFSFTWNLFFSSYIETTQLKLKKASR